MDLNQRKLDKSEWDSIEVPVISEEKEILTLITNGYHNVNIKYNSNKSLICFLKIDYKENIEDYLFVKYFNDKISNIQKKYPPFAELFTVSIKGKPFINKADGIRIEKNSIEKIIDSGVFEYVLISIIEQIMSFKKINNNVWITYYFTLYKLNHIHISFINSHIKIIVDRLLAHFEDE